MSAKKQINLLRGWPNPALLPTSAIQTAARNALSDPRVSTPGLLYGPDPGYQPLRNSISKWLSDFYDGAAVPRNGREAREIKEDDDGGDRICITGGASQNLACLLQVFTDPLYTHVWMVAPSYFLACRIFEDAGLRTRAVGEGAEGVDLVALEEGLKSCEREADREMVGPLEICKEDWETW
jgi:DNA-binding transcriptional MocR family regulator